MTAYIRKYTNCDLFFFLIFIVLFHFSDSLKQKLSFVDRINNKFNEEELVKIKPFLRNIDPKNKIKFIQITQETNILEKKSFQIKYLNNSEYQIKNFDTNQYFYINITNPFDEYQLAKVDMCDEKNCKYPNVCITSIICGCDNHYANFFIKKQENGQVNYCNYKRKSPVIVSMLELLFPGVGFFYAETFIYATIKFILGLIFYSLVLLKYFNILKDKTNENNGKSNLNSNLLSKNEERENLFNNEVNINNSYIDIRKSLNNNKNESVLSNNKNVSFASFPNKNENVLISLNNKIIKDRKNERSQNKWSIWSIIITTFGTGLLVWLFIDFVLIGMRAKGDGNGVGFIIYPNYGNSV